MRDPPPPPHEKKNESHTSLYQQVFLVGNAVVKIFVEGGLEAALYCLGTEVLYKKYVFLIS